MKLKKDAENGETLVGGFIRTDGGTSHVQVEGRRPDELSEAAAEVTPHPRPWTKLPRKRRVKIALMSISKDILNSGDPRYHRALRLANAYRKVRASELANMHGHVSSGASALLASASLAMAASRFLYERFAEDGAPGAGEISLLKQAASLADSARQSELAAWELSAREGVLKRKMDAANQGMPWLQQDSTREKPGRKTNAQRQLMAADTPPLTTPRVMTIDELVTPRDAKESKKNVVESNRRGAVPGVHGVPSDAGEPDGGSDPRNSSADGDSGTEAGVDRKERSDSQTRGIAGAYWDYSAAGAVRRTETTAAGQSRFGDHAEGGAGRKK